MFASPAREVTCRHAVVAELVYALVLGTSLFGDESSSLSDRTKRIVLFVSGPFIRFFNLGWPGYVFGTSIAISWDIHAGHRN